MFYDTHVHTTYSCDGVTELDKFTLSVDSGTIKGVGFAEHIDFMPICGSYGYLDFRSYLEAVEEFREKGYEFYAGGEIDYVKKVEAEIIEHMQQYKYAFTICSVHMVDGIAVSNRTDFADIIDRQIRRDTLIRYHEELRWGIKAPVFDVMGHIGVYKRYLGKDFFEDIALVNEIHEMEDEIALLCAKSDKIVEVNTSGLFAPFTSTVPDVRFLKEYYRHGGRSISVGSDAHCIEHLGRGFAAAHEILREIGFEYTLLPWDKESPQRL